jgi:glycosyltransferase involved in cell wall biosynthesis
MSEQPLVSVITIFFNAETFIREAVDSVVAQTYPRWELLLVDDGSTDASSRIAREYAGATPGRVRYVEHPGHAHRGTGPSRNLGLRHARGPAIAFLDADDVWLPHKLERQVAILASHPEVAMVYGPAEVWYSWTGAPDDARRDVVPAKRGLPLDTVIDPPALLPHLLRNTCVEPFPSSILVRRPAIDRVGGFEERFRGIFEDQVLFAKLCLSSPVYVASDCWHRYRRHPDSVCATVWRTGQYHAAWLTFLAWLAGYLWRRRVRDGDVWTVLRRELGPYPHPVVYRLTARARRLVPRAGRAVLPALVRRRLREAGRRRGPGSGRGPSGP